MGSRLPKMTREKGWIVGVMLLAGAFAAVLARGYDLGTLRAMGPGYFPLLLGLSLCAIALLIVLEPVGDPGEGDRVPAGRRLRPIVFVLSAILLFAGLIRTAGFVPAVFGCVVLAGLAERQNRLMQLLFLAAVATALSGLVFVYALGIPVRLVAL